MAALGHEWDVLEWQRQYDAQQKRACDAVAEVERLRAAIADLLAVTEQALKAIESLGKWHLGEGVAFDGSFRWPLRDELRDKLRAAIAKAKEAIGE